MGHKAVETTMHLARELLTNVQCSGGPKSLAKETGALKMRGVVAGRQKLTKTNWEHHQNWSSYNYSRSCPRTQRWHSMGIWSKLERWKSLISGFLMSRLQIKKKKKSSFWSVIFSCYTTRTNHFLIKLWHMMKSRFYMTTGNDQLSGWTEKKLQSTSWSQIFTRKMSWSLFGGLLSVWSTTAFWILEKPLHLRSMLSDRWDAPKTAKPAACSSIGQQKGLHYNAWLHVPQPMLQKPNELMRFCLIHLLTSCQLTTTSSIIITFCKENASTTSIRQKMLSKISLNPEAQIFMLQE